MLPLNNYWKSSLFFVLLLGFSSFLSAQTGESQTAVYFNTASAELSQLAKEKLSILAGNLNKQVDYSLEIAAHTDARGTVSYNKDLAEQRAHSVKNYLAELGITTDELTVSNYGESQADGNSNQIIMQKQRRVDVLIEAYNWASLDDMVQELQSDLWTQYQIDPSQDQLIEGPDGGRFFIEANSLVDAQGNPVTSPVNINLVECYSFEKMLLMQLSTSAQGRILETGGMLALTAETLDGQELFLAPGRSIAAKIPTEIFREDMTIFYADGDPNSGPQDWTNSGQKVKGDFKAILRIAERPDFPEQRSVSFNGDWRNQLDEPQPPKKPQIIKGIKPRKPLKTKKRYHPRGISKLLAGDKKRARKEDELYQAALEEYEIDLEKYERRQKNNAYKIAKYEKDWEKYETDYQSWKARNKAEYLAKYETSEAYAKQAEYDSIFQVRLAQYKEDLGVWQQYKDKKVQRYEEALMAGGDISDEQLDSYFFNIQKLGWVNCDVFSRLANDGNFAELRARDMSQEKARVFMVFKEQPSILNFIAAGKGEYTLEVPGSMEVDILAYKITDGKVMLARQEFITGDTNELDLQFEKVRLREFRQTLRALKEG